MKEKRTKGVAVKLIVCVAVSMAVAVSIAIVFVYTQMDKLLTESFLVICDTSSDALTKQVENYTADSQNSVASLLRTAAFNESYGATTTKGMQEAMSHLVETSPIEFFVAQDLDGNVFASTGLYKVGEKAADLASTRAAREGKEYADVIKSKDDSLLAMAAAPIKSRSGSVVGVLSGGYFLNSEHIVDNLKATTASDFTIFDGNMRVNTTIMQDGNRQVGTPLAQNIADIVITGGKEFSGQTDILGDTYITKYIPIKDKNNDVLGVLFTGKNIQAINKASATVLLVTSLTAIAFFVIGMAIFLRVVSKDITKPVRQIEEAAVRMAKGDYDVNLTYKSDNEVGNLANSMREMMSTTKLILEDTSNIITEISNSNFNVSTSVEYVGIFKMIEFALKDITIGLSKTMQNIELASSEVSNGADQVSSNAQSLASGATEQASSIEELSASITEITQQVNHNAESAIKADKMSSEASSAIQDSNQKMQQLMIAMNQINVKSSEISKIIKTIEDIAFQTNILALNAAVEAARAGAAGKGFAVVADEVRNLATKSSEAAKNTTVLIEDSVVAINDGVKLAKLTADELVSVVDGAEQTTLTIAEITRATQDQAVLLSQLSSGIDQISAVVQVNSATSEESAASAEELSAQAKLMKDLIAQFKLLNTDFID